VVNHGKVRACTSPENITIDEYSVWVAENIITVTVQDEEGTHTEYEFDLKQYDKDEYIHSMDDQLTDAQLALCELYEIIGGV
jgi:hypothetical protein